MIKNNLGSSVLHTLVLVWKRHDFWCLANFSYKHVAISLKYACMWNDILFHHERTRNRIGACVVPPLVSHIYLCIEKYMQAKWFLCWVFFWKLNFFSGPSTLKAMLHVYYTRGPRTLTRSPNVIQPRKKNSQKGKLIITLWGKINQLRDGRLYSQVNLSQN